MTKSYRYIIRKGASEHSIEDVASGAVYDLRAVDIDTKEGIAMMGIIAANISAEKRLVPGGF